MEVLINISKAQTEDDRRRFALTSSLDEEVRELANPFDQVQNALVGWYLEEHPMRDPLERRKASIAEIELGRYGTRIAQAVGLSQTSMSTKGGEISVKIQQGDHTGISGHGLLWEALESANENENDNLSKPPVVVSRLVTPNNVDGQPLRQNGNGPFRILLVVARADLTESNHRIIATTLLRIANAMGSSQIEVELVRPGTFSELESHLIRSSTRSKPIDLVHFDLHGVIKPVKDEEGCTNYLQFFPQDETKSGLHKASELATLLRHHRIPMVVVNACESARSDRGPRIVPIAYTALGLDPSRMRATSSAPIEDILCGASPRNQEMDNLDQSFDMEVLNVETRLCDPWQCGAGPIVNICGYDGIGKHTFLEHCKQWWTKTAFFDRILTYTHPRGEAYPTASGIQVWMASQLEPNKNPSEASAEKVVVGWIGRGRNRTRLLVILENLSIFKLDEGIPKRSRSLVEEQEWHALFEWATAKKIWVVLSSCSKLELVSKYPSEDNEKHTSPVEPMKYKGGQETPVDSPYYYLPGMRNGITQTGNPRTFFSSLTTIEDLSGMKSLIDCLAGLPRMVELALSERALDSAIVGKSAAAVVAYLTSGRDIFRQDEDFERHLIEDPIFGLLGSYFDHEQEAEMLNFLGALEMWLEEGVDHRDYSYPKRLFNNFYTPIPRLADGIEPSQLAPFVFRLQDRLGQVFQDLDHDSRPSQRDAGGKVYRFVRRLNVFQYLGRSRLAEAIEIDRVRARWQHYAALALYLKLGNWLSYYNVIHGKPESAAEQIRRCSQIVSVHLTPYRLHETLASAFPLWLTGFPRLADKFASMSPPKLAQELHMINNTKGLNRDEQIVQLMSSTLQRARSVTLQSWTRAMEDNERRFQAFQTWLLDGQDGAYRQWATTGLELLKKGWGQKHSAETWGYRTREEVQEINTEARAELRRAFIAVAGTPQSFFDRLVEGTQFLARIANRWISTQIDDNSSADSDTEESPVGGLVGVLASLVGGTVSDMNEMLGDIDVEETIEGMPGIQGVMEVWEILKQGLAELRAGTSPAKVFDDFYPRLAAIDAQFWWRRALVFMLTFNMDDNDLFKVVSAHQLLIKSFIDRRDWEGLDQHLGKIDLDAEQGGKCQWYAVRGICSMHLRKWEESETYLRRSVAEMNVGKRDEYMLGNFGIFGLSGGYTIQFMLVRFMIVAKYGGGDECTPGLLPAWGVFLEALSLGYGAPIGLLYRWNGAILEQLCQHYLEPLGSHGDPERVIEMPAQADYGAVIRSYVLPAGLEEGVEITEIDDNQRPLYLLLEFLHRKRARNEMEYEELADFNSSKAFFDLYTQPNGATKLPLSRNSALVVFLEELKQELSRNWEKKLDVLETFEQYLMGRSVAGIPEGLVRMGECPVIEGPAVWG